MTRLDKYKKLFTQLNIDSNSKSTENTMGWNERRACAWWDPDSWLIEYVEVKKHVIKTYLEGKLILDLNLFVNIECYRDRHELL